MLNDEYLINRKSDYHSNVSLEKFKKMTFEIIERKDKLINMLYGILEMVGVTNLSIKEIMSRYSNSSKHELIESRTHKLMDNNKTISPRKRLRLDIPNQRSTKKKRILNIFSTPQNIYEPLHNDKNLDTTISNCDNKLLSTSKKEITNCQNRINEFSKTEIPDGCELEQELEHETEPSPLHQKQHQQKTETEKENELQKELQLQELQQQLIDARNGNLLSARKHNVSLKRNLIEQQIRARENLKFQESKFELSNEDLDTQRTLDSEINDNSVESTEEEEEKKKEEKKKEEEEKKEEITEIEEETCYVCLMPMRESLIGSFPPSHFKLRCGHIFHLKCLYEVVRRRNIRQTCCTCQEILNEKDKKAIIEKIKIEKKEHRKMNKTLIKMLRMQAHEK